MKTPGQAEPLTPTPSRHASMVKAEGSGPPAVGEAGDGAAAQEPRPAASGADGVPEARSPAPAAQPMRRAACIVGEVQSRQGDGTNFLIRKGPCSVQLTALDATIAWRDGDSQGLAAMPLSDFNTHLRSGALAFVDAATG